jgi:hypothetical protein
MTALRTGDTAARTVSGRIAAPVANLAALATVGVANASDGQLALDKATGYEWRFSAACALTADNILVAGSGSGNGRWLLVPGARKLVLPVTFATADAAVLLTVPTGALLALRRFYWTITTNWTGGTASAIGASSAKTGFTTKGDLHGGATGNVLAELTTALSPQPLTMGVKFDTFAETQPVALWKAGDNIIFDRITSIFTAGAGALNVICDVLENAGA